MTARYFKRCGCRGEDGKQLKAGCSKIGQRNHGTWTARVELPRTNGQRNTKERSGFRTKAEAEVWVEQLLEAHKKGARKIDPKLTTGEWLDRWLAAKTSTTGVSGYGATVRSSTAAVYRLHVDYLKEHIGGVLLQDLNVDHVVSAYDAIRADSEAKAAKIDRTNVVRNEGRAARGEEPLAFAPAKRIGQTSIKRIHACLRAALQAAVKTGHKPYNPCLQVTFEARQQRDERPQQWSPAQLSTFLQATRGQRLGIVFEVLAASGMRRGEALGLGWADVDMDRGVLRVRRQLLNSWRDGAPEFGPAKSEAGNRLVALPQSTVDALKLHRLAQDAERDAWGDAYEDFGLVFCQQNGRPFDPSKVTKTFSALAKAAGLPKARLHDLRHQAATRQLANGVPIAVVSKRLGHSSIDITVDTYGHQDEQADRAAAEAGWGLMAPPAEVRADQP